MEFSSGCVENDSTDQKPFNAALNVRHNLPLRFYDKAELSSRCVENDSTDQKPFNATLNVQQNHPLRFYDMVDYSSGCVENDSTDQKPFNAAINVQQNLPLRFYDTAKLSSGCFENDSTDQKPFNAALNVQQNLPLRFYDTAELSSGCVGNDSTDQKPFNAALNVQHNLPLSFYNKAELSSGCVGNDSTDQKPFNAALNVQHNLPLRFYNKAELSSGCVENDSTDQKPFNAALNVQHNLPLRFYNKTELSTGCVENNSTDQKPFNAALNVQQNLPLRFYDTAKLSSGCVENDSTDQKPFNAALNVQQNLPLRFYDTAELSSGCVGNDSTDQKPFNDALNVQHNLPLSFYNKAELSSGCVGNDSTDQKPFNAALNVQHNLPLSFYNKAELSSGCVENDSTDQKPFNAALNVQHNLPLRFYNKTELSTGCVENDSIDQKSINAALNVQHNLPLKFDDMAELSSGCVENDSTDQKPFNAALNVQHIQNLHHDHSLKSDNDPRKPLDDIQYLLDNAICFQEKHEFPKKKKKPSNKDDFQFTNQFIFGLHLPPYYSVLHFSLMEKLVAHLKNSNKVITNQLLMKYVDIIDYERECFAAWLSELWEKKLKHRRLNVVPHVENYVKSACEFSNSYIKSHYSGMYKSKMKIDYFTEEETVMDTNITMTHCERIKSSNVKYAASFPTIDITNLENKITFNNEGIYTPPQKSPFVDDELCRTLSKENNIDIAMCLSSIKHIMNLEKPNSLWLMPVNIIVDDDNRKSIFIGGALATRHFSQQQKSLFYLRKEIRKKFTTLLENNSNIQDGSKYNYDKWILAATNKSNDIVKSLNILIRNISHINIPNKTYLERILIPKVEYQPEFGFEKPTEEQLVEYWIDTYFRNPKCNFSIVSVQYNMDIMMIKKNNPIEDLISDANKQMYLQRLYQTLDKCLQLDEGQYMMLHNPKKPFEIELFQSYVYGGFNLINMHYILGEAEVADSLTWNPIDEKVICPIHDHFKVPPCMFRPSLTMLNIRMINNQVNKIKAQKEAKERMEKEKSDRRKFVRKEKKKAKLKRKKDDLLSNNKS